jgi:hypothetical protein
MKLKKLACYGIALGMAGRRHGAGAGYDSALASSPH